MKNWVMIGYAIVLHTVWGVLLLLDSATAGATPLGRLSNWFDRWPLAGLLLGVAALALWALRLHGRRGAILLLLPQQAVLIISASSALQAITMSQYADGVPRPLPFILADQLPAVLAAVGHTLAIIYAGGPKEGK